MSSMQRNIYVLQPNGNYEVAVNVENFEIKDGCLIIFLWNSEVVGYNTHQWVTFTSQLEEV